MVEQCGILDPEALHEYVQKQKAKREAIDAETAKAVAQLDAVGRELEKELGELIRARTERQKIELQSQRLQLAKERQQLARAKFEQQKHNKEQAHESGGTGLGARDIGYLIGTAASVLALLGALVMFFFTFGN